MPETFSWNLNKACFLFVELCRASFQLPTGTSGLDWMTDHIAPRLKSKTIFKNSFSCKWKLHFTILYLGRFLVNILLQKFRTMNYGI
jgi:hypothetical protein